MTTFAIVKDERVTYVDFRQLQERKIICCSKKEMQRRAKATVVSIAVAARERRKFADDQLKRQSA
jgi:hypothetical protein